MTLTAFLRAFLTGMLTATAACLFQSDQSYRRARALVTAYNASASREPPNRIHVDLGFRWRFSRHTLPIQAKLWLRLRDGY